MNADLLIATDGCATIITDTSWEKHGSVTSVVLKVDDFTLGLMLDSGKIAVLNIPVPDYVRDMLMSQGSVFLSEMKGAKITRVESFPLIIKDASGQSGKGGDTRRYKQSLEDFDDLLNHVEYHEALHRSDLNDDSFTYVFDSRNQTAIGRYDYRMRSQLEKERSQSGYKQKHYTPEHVMHLRPGKRRK